MFAGHGDVIKIQVIACITLRDPLINMADSEEKDEIEKPVRRKAMSAPARFSSREDVWKEIRDWAKPSGSGTTNNTFGAQLKDNVTEQRLLESRLMDLSKERYKFIVQVAWQRKAFIDKQKTKTGQMKELLGGIEAAQIKTSKKNLANQLRAKNKLYSDLRHQCYADRKIRGNSAKNFLEEMKPICIEPVFRTQQTFGSRGSPNRFGLDSRRAVFPDIVSASKQSDRSEPVPRLPTRQSCPADMVGRSRQTTNASRQTCYSAANVPKYLRFRSVYDRRFSGLEGALSNTYSEEQKSFSSFRSGLPSEISSSAPT